VVPSVSVRVPVELGATAPGDRPWPHPEEVEPPEVTTAGVEVTEDEVPAQAVRDHARAVKPTTNHVVLLTGRSPARGPWTPEHDSAQRRHPDARPAPSGDSTATTGTETSALPITACDRSAHRPIAGPQIAEDRTADIGPPFSSNQIKSAGHSAEELFMVDQMIPVVQQIRLGGDAPLEPVICRGPRNQPLSEPGPNQTVAPRLRVICLTLSGNGDGIGRR
jgi:hypothetical protein